MELLIYLDLVELIEQFYTCKYVVSYYDIMAWSALVISQWLVK